MIILKLLLVICALFIQQSPSSKGQLIVEHADRNMGKEVEGEQLRILEGNVHIRQDTLNMFCDRAVFFESKDKLEFTGNVLIDNGHRKLRAEKIDYYPNRNWADCFGHVVITGKTDSLYSRKFSYDFDAEYAVAEGNLYLADFENNVKIWGQFGTYEARNNRSKVRTDARLVQIDSSSQDSFIVTANRLKYIADSLAMAIALDSVTILQGKLKAICDSAIYFPDEEVARLYKKPVVWYENNELEGEEIKAIFDSLEIKFIEVTGDAIARSVVDSLKEKVNILKGEKIEFTIEEGEPRRIVSQVNAVSIYYLEENGVDQGTNFATSDTIYIYFEEGQLDSIDIIGGSEGIFYPENYKGEKAFE